MTILHAVGFDRISSRIRQNAGMPTEPVAAFARMRALRPAFWRMRLQLPLLQLQHAGARLARETCVAIASLLLDRIEVLLGHDVKHSVARNGSTAYRFFHFDLGDQLLLLPVGVNEE